MSPDNPNKPPVVFVHGLWLHAESWKNWVEFFRGNGYNAVAASWPRRQLKAQNCIPSEFPSPLISLSDSEYRHT
jgi:hypothetical protein